VATPAIDTGVIGEETETLAGNQVRRIAEYDFHAGADLRTAQGGGRRTRSDQRQRHEDVRTYHESNVPAVSAFRSVRTLALVAGLATPPARAQERPPRRPPLPAAADTNDWEAYYDAGVELLNGAALVRARRGTEGAGELKAAIALEPYFADPYFWLGEAMLAQHDSSAALADYQNYLARASSRAPQPGAARARVAALQPSREE